MHKTQFIVGLFPQAELILVHIILFEFFVQTVTHLAHAKFWFKAIVKQNQNINLFLLIKKNLEEINPLCGIADIPVLDFRWHLLSASKPERTAFFILIGGLHVKLWTDRAAAAASSVKLQIGSIGSIVYMVTLPVTLGNGSILKRYHWLALVPLMLPLPLGVFIPLHVPWNSPLVRLSYADLAQICVFLCSYVNFLLVDKFRSRSCATCRSWGRSYNQNPRCPCWVSRRLSRLQRQRSVPHYPTKYTIQ